MTFTVYSVPIICSNIGGEWVGLIKSVN
jgi:hypothetical protein